MKRIILSALLIAFVVSGSYFLYKKFLKSKTKSLHSEMSDSPEPGAGSVTLDKEQLDLFHITTVRIEKRNFRRTISLIGEVAPVPDRIIEVPARVAGRIVTVKFVEGSQVSKGQLLAVLDSPDLARLRSAYNSAKTRHSAASQNVDRVRNLVSMKLAAKQEEIDAEANLKVIAADLKASEENLRANGLEPGEETTGKYYIHSPIAGIVLNRNALPGAMVPGTQNLATIGNISELWFMAKIFEADLGKVTEGDKADVVLNSYPDLLFEGVLEHIGEQVDIASRTVHARLVFKNKGRKAKIGLFGTAKVVTDTGSGILVPESSIFKISNSDYVFIRKDSDTYIPKIVRVANSEDGMVEILNGLDPGEEVVTQGVFELKSLLLKSSFGEEG
ncbi:efflux transporter, RND family, MFP subunit [Leptospira fainei serovar Hurstbridge str. BUT 6]|uniref:Efflux transporter, RND family, MFP subunit n=1 Tax=Leptospira fainei serovar Hurstbridge str. BUT 6 TaxID=1193011 RepID=S3V120_9LEPT|nr:efflux RND transporter periplasmic adaptor subunit [Leptospira fainei]EPG75143.1 efflux transporter, RND family, MFP subunit [Leptospira fainei serovar Hurstbridge str. BUT 6]